MSETKSGFLVVNKNSGITSHDTVLQARKILGIKKIGHSGTLDAPASGVLVLGMGKATRLLQFITALPKKYRTELVFGKSTDTGDNTGQVLEEKEVPILELEKIRAASQKFIGDIEQIPPMHSAKKVGGKRLYELAYRGESIEREPQKVTIYNIEVDWLDESKQIASMEVECSVGTYIRTLGFDIAHEMGIPAHIQNLCRLSIGFFEIDTAVCLETDDIDEMKIISPAKGMSDYKSYFLTDEAEVTDLRNGKSIPISNMESVKPGLNITPEICAALYKNQEDELIAVCETRKDKLHPKIVLAN